MDFKPILTYSGDVPLFRSLESQIASSVPHDTCEWRRSYGRPIKNVRVEAKFQQLDTKILDKYKIGDWSILEHPVLHIYVTECNDVETYKSSVKEEIDLWLKLLQSYNISDWMILLVETVDVKKSKNILPRTTVLDKIRLDFATKNGDRCISVLNPMKFEIKSTESFRCLLQRIRHLILSGYNRNIIKYEELIRSNREKRNTDGWSFIKYFLLQEQLAFVLEMLGLYSEALVQYDELDAMLSQFILNSVYGDKQQWLEIFEKQFTTFYGITMSKTKMFDKRKKIETNVISLLEFRSYLFERQCILLKLSGKHWEIAERLLPFLFATLREIEALKLETPEGALACWEFICALEVLDTCDQVNESKEIHKCFQFTAPIWNLAKDKLYELGKICGLLPGFTPTSEQLHTVVQLSAGIGDSITDELIDNQIHEQPVKQDIIKLPTSAASTVNRRPKLTPTDRLKEALGSNESFQKLYLELSELAISTYKHVSRLRSARLVGLDLGNFYCTLNEPQKAVVFFTDLLRELKQENWNYLASQTLLELASCYRKMNDLISYTKICSTISCCSDLEILVRTFYFDEFLKSLNQLVATLASAGDTIDYTINPNTSTNNINNNSFAVLEDHFKVININCLNENFTIIQDNYINVELKLESYFPREILCENILLSYEICCKQANESTVQDLRTSFFKSKLPISIHLDYKQDNSLNCSSVVCDIKNKQLVRRSSSTRRKISPTIRTDFTNNVTIDNYLIKPGINIIQLKSKATRVGTWNFKQLSIKIKAIEFLSENLLINKLNKFTITTKPSSAVLSFLNLIAGIMQPIKLIISAGSFIFPKDSFISLKCSKNLRLRIKNQQTNDDDFQRELTIMLTNFKPFDEKIIDLDAITELPGRREEKPIVQKVVLHCPWSRNDIEIPLHFVPAIITSCRLHSSGTRKFLQVVIKGIYENKLLLTNVKMNCLSKGVTLNDINPVSQHENIIFKNLTISYLWEIQVEPLKTENELPVIHVDFSMEYAEPLTPNYKRNYSCTFDVMDYTTLFKVHAKVEPSELCRVGSVCHLNLKITKIQDNPFIDLMYEVIPDQNIWAVCGRSAGVVSMQDIEYQSITLDVLPLCTGFLPLPNIRLSKYISANKLKSETHPRLQPFPPGQIYNSTKSIQVHVLANNNIE